MSLDSLVTWAAHSGTAERVELLCAEHPDPQRGHRAWKPIQAPGCLTELPLQVPLELLALGVDEIAIRTDGCTAPEALEVRRTRWATHFEMAGRTLSEPVPGRRRREVLAAANMPTVERRSLFGLGRREPRPEHAWQPDIQATDHQRLRAALRHLQARPTGAGAADGVGWHVLADGCRANGQCVTACPHDALRLDHTTQPDGSQRSELLFDASLCNACGRCIEFCDADALSAGNATTFNDLVDAVPMGIATLTTRRCERCRASFVPAGADDALCPVCSARRTNPFGSALPPEAVERLRRMREDSAG